MPTLRFANLGSTPGNSNVSVAGNLYILMTEDSTTAIVFDNRRYQIKIPSEDEKLTFRRIGDVEVAVLPESRLKLFKTDPSDYVSPFPLLLGNLRQVYVVSLSESPSMIGWRRLYDLFPNAEISNIPLGKTDWNPIQEEERKREIIHAIESTDLVDRGEKIRIGPFMLFLFRDKVSDRPASILIAGEVMSRPFAFFFGSDKFKTYFRSDRVRAKPTRIHNLNAGKWFAFYPSAGLPPVKEPLGQT